MAFPQARVFAVMLLSVPLLFGAVALSAQSEPEDLIKYRQSHMRAQAGHLGAMVQIINGGAGASIPATRPRQEPAHIDRLSGERVSGGFRFR